MGSVGPLGAATFGKALPGLFGSNGGLDKVGDTLGLGGKQNPYWSPTPMDGTGYEQQKADVGAEQDPNVNNALSGYANGSMSLNDVLNARGPAWQGAMAHELAMNPLTGSTLATNQVTSNPVLAGLYGQGGQLSQAEDQATQLQKQGFQLQPQDVEAYGQASGNIGRQYGQTGNALQSALASRGLTGPGTNAGAVAFSGLQGNQNEALAQAQYQIADARMKNTTQRLNDTRNYVSQLGQGGANAIQSQYNRNIGGVDQQQKQTQSQIGNALEVNKNNNTNSLGSFQSAQENKDPTLGRLFGQGLGQSTTAIGQSPGRGSNAYSSSVGSGLGKMSGGGMGG